MKVRKTKFDVEGSKEPCFEVSTDSNSVLVRISTCHHYIGSNTLYVTQYLDGKFDSRDEIKGDFETLTKGEALQLAKELCAYLPK